MHNTAPDSRWWLAWRPHLLVPVMPSILVIAEQEGPRSDPKDHNNTEVHSGLHVLLFARSARVLNFFDGLTCHAEVATLRASDDSKKVLHLRTG